MIMHSPENKNKRVAIAMSGGVDSSVAAYLLKKEGYDVVGFSMQLWPKNAGGGCCGVNALNDAARVAAELGIPHYTLDVRGEFREKVIDNFYSEYEQGLTPNPCVKCNEFIKFDYLMKKAAELDAKLATGHYAQIVYNEKTNEYDLLKGVDPKKDQSYALCRLSQHQIANSLFPVGGFTKEKIREIAREANIYVAEKPESQDICFQDKTNFRELMAENAPRGVRPGDIVTTEGEIIGKHQGIAFYTIGQRKRLGISSPHPLYVLGIDAEANRIVVGKEEELANETLTAANVNMLTKSIGSKPFRAKAKIRYASSEVEAEITLKENSGAHVSFFEPVKAITPGQFVVFYDGNRVLGGGVITSGTARQEINTGVKNETH